MSSTTTRLAALAAAISVSLSCHAQRKVNLSGPDIQVAGVLPAVNGGYPAHGYKGAWSSTATYGYLDRVLYANQYWESAVANNTNNTPSSSSSQWYAFTGVIAPAAGTSSSGTYSMLVPTGAINGTNATFTLPSAPASASVYLNGVLQNPSTDYTLSGATLAETSPPQAGDVLTVAASSIASGAVGSLTPLVPTGAINGTNTAYTVSGSPNTILLFLNGVQQPNSAFSFSSPTITLTTAPSTGDSLVYIPIS